MPKLTKRIVDAAEARPAEHFIWDAEVPGFGLRVLTSGRKSYIVQYRAGRRSRRISLGLSTVLTCEQARTRAITVIAATRNGEDPASKRDTSRRAVAVADLADRFDREHIALHIKASTAKEYRRNLRRFILPALGRLRVTELTRADVAKFHHDRRHIPYQANRCLEIISKTFSLAELWGLRPDGRNPRKHVRKYPEEKRQRFLSPAELRRVGEVLREMEDEGVEFAGLKDVRIHDLRHTFASTAVAGGQGLPMIGKLLGHTQVQTTARYAHLAADPVKLAANNLAQALAAALTP